MSFSTQNFKSLLTMAFFSSISMLMSELIRRFTGASSGGVWTVRRERIFMIWGIDLEKAFVRVGQKCVMLNTNFSVSDST